MHRLVRTKLILGLCLILPAAAAAAVRPLFVPQSTTQSPFPSDRFTVSDLEQLTGRRVNLPMPDCTARPSDCQDVAMLNQLDGFNGQPRISIPFDGAIDLSTVTSQNIFLVPIVGGHDPVDLTHLIGINQIVWDPALLTLFVHPNDQLDQDTRYLIVVTDNVRGADGKSIQVPRVPDSTDTDETTDQPSPRKYASIVERFLNKDTRGHNVRVVLADTFTTGSVTATLEKIRQQIKGAPAPSVSFNIGSAGQRTVFSVSSIIGVLFNPQNHTTGPLGPSSPIPTPALQIFPGSVASIAFGKFPSKNFEVAGGFIPSVPTKDGVPAVQSTQDVYFNLFIPSGPRPSNGWPVAIYGHGFGDNKNNSPFAVASTMANNGIATIAINVVGHDFGPNGTLTVIRGSGATVLPAGGRGTDLNGDTTIDSTEGLLAAGAQRDIAARDGMQQTVADLMQLVRAIQGGIDVDGNGSTALDAHRIYYFGQSLGGIYGTILLGIEPDIQAGVPNVPGGTFVDITRIGLSFRPLLGQFLAVRTPSLINAGGLNFNDNMPLRDQPPVTNTVPGAIDIQSLEDTANWISQSGDPVSWAPFIRKSPLAGSLPKPVIIQFARGDETNPNPTTTAIIRSGDLADRATLFRNDLAFALGVGFGKNPHTFLTNIAGTPAVASVAIGAQSQIGVFFATNGFLTIDPDGAGPLFEVPINGALPEDTAFIP